VAPAGQTRIFKQNETMTSINQFHSNLAKGDAITNEIFAIKDRLIKAGYKSAVYARHISSEFRGMAKPLMSYEGNSGSILLIHHSMGIFQDDFRRVNRLPDKKILIYHNITPIEFLSNPHLRLMSRVGREQLAGYRRHVDLAFADSEYSRKELMEKGFKNTGVLPIVIDFDRYSVEPDTNTLRRLRDYTNILFVGRLAKNKRQEDLLKIFYYYHHYLNSKSNLVFLHHLSFDPQYERYLKELATSLRVSDSVIFVATDSVKDLTTYFRAASLFLCMSEHEGFCVPLVESMYFHVPIMAYNSTAVPYTLNGAGILLDEKRFDQIAALVNMILNDKELHRKIIDGQDRRLTELMPEKSISKLLEIAGKIMPHTSTRDHMALVDHSVPVSGERNGNSLQIAMITPWSANDGIAQYSKSLLDNSSNADPELRFTIFASSVGDKKDKKWSENVAERCWMPWGNPTNLLRSLEGNQAELVHIQFNLGFFQPRHLADIIRVIRHQGKKLIITFHSTAPVITDNMLVDLEAQADALSNVDLILVHTKNDLDRLYRYGIANVRLFPHGFPNPIPVTMRADASIESVLKGRPIVAMNGYFLPHKGIFETIRAIKILLPRYPDVLLLVVCGIHHDASSSAYFNQCRNEVQQLNLTRNVSLMTDIYETDEILQVLSLANIMVLPYKDTQESSSAAVRLPLAACRPVIVTDRSIFSEFSNEVFKIKDCTPPEIATAITDVFESEDLKNSLIAAASKRAKADCWTNVGHTYAQLVRELVQHASIKTNV
jgi:glycosyltransferase involved in cell wall biosynthesis